MKSKSLSRSLFQSLSLLLLSMETLRPEMHILTKISNYAPHLHDLTCICMCLCRMLCVRPVFNTAERGAVNKLYPETKPNGRQPCWKFNESLLTNVVRGGRTDGVTDRDISLKTYIVYTTNVNATVSKKLHFTCDCPILVAYYRYYISYLLILEGFLNHRYQLIIQMIFNKLKKSFL